MKFTFKIIPDEFSGKVALVTGAGTGNGEAIAARLYAGGACVGLANRNFDAVKKVAQEIDTEGKRTLPIKVDVRDSESVRKMVEITLDKFGALHLAVNNAGITGPGETNVPELDIDIWHDVIETDLSGVFYGLKYEIPAMIQSGGGAIVNMSSANGVVGLAGLAAYTTAKHGVIGLTRSVALEYADKNVRVCAVAPGYVETPRIRESGEEALAFMASAHPLGRLATREEVASLVAYTKSDWQK